MARLVQAYEATPGTVTVNHATLNAANELRLNDWLWEFYAPTDTDEQSPTFGQKLTRNNANMAQAYRNFAAAIWLGIVNNVKRWELDVAKAAVPNPGDLG